MLFRAAIALAFALLACGQNHAPRLSPLVNREARVGSAIEIFVFANDPDGDALRFSAEGLPERATFESTTLGARFLWTPLSSDVPPGEAAATYPVTFVVSDGRGGRDAETVLVTVSRGGPGDGAPVFVTPSDYVLDLEATDTLDVSVTVQDDDSSEVTLSLDEAPEGAILERLGTKSAELVWKPTEAQIAARALYTLRVRAEDGDTEPVVQEITVLLRRKEGAACPGEVPTVSHVPLGDRTAPGPYRVEATLVDPDGRIRAGTLFWSRRPSPTAADFESVAMRRETSAPDLYAASIPDLALRAGESATVTYFLCATDDDDSSGDACDHSTCFPSAQGRLAFTASIGSACPEDGQEPNDTAGAAKPVTSGTPVRSLRMCGGNDDWFSIALAAGDVLDAGITFAGEGVDLSLEAYAPGGTTRLQTAAGGMGAAEKRLSLTATTAGTYLLRVSAASGVSATYDLSATSRPGASCTDDRQEPNDTASTARAVNVGTLSGLQICAANDDWYGINLRAGDGLDASITFTNQRGDLDLEVVRPDGATVLGKSEGVGDGESLSFRVVPDTGRYLVHVYGYRGAQNAYALTLSGASCRNDSFEPNEARAAAKTLPAGTTRGLALCAGDEDWFKVNVTAGKRLRVAVRFKQSQGDLDLQVLKPDGTNLASSFSLDDDELVDVPAVPTTGDYAIKVFSLSGAQNAYEIELTVGP